MVQDVEATVFDANVTAVIVIQESGVLVTIRSHTDKVANSPPKSEQYEHKGNGQKFQIHLFDGFGHNGLGIGICVIGRY